MTYTFERDGTFWCKLWIHTIVDTDLEVAHFYYSNFLFSLDNNLNIFVKSSKVPGTHWVHAHMHISELHIDACFFVVFAIVDKVIFIKNCTYAHVVHVYFAISHIPCP